MNKKGLLAILITVFVWGSSFAAAKIGLQEIEPFTLALLRAILATMFLIIIIFVKREQKELLKAIKVDWKYFLLLGLIGIALFGIFQNVGVKYTSSALAGILQNTNPLFILILSGLFLREIITKNKVIGLILGFLGMCSIVFAGENLKEIFKSQTLLGNILILASAISWAIYSILNKRVFNKYSPLHLTAVAYVLGTIFLIPTAIVFGSITEISILTLKSWLVIFYLGIVSSGIAFLTWNYALSKMEASKASVFLYLIPVMAIAVGYLFLGEHVTIYMIGGAVLVLGGIYLTEKVSS